MDIKSLEKDELVDLTAMLGARLAKAVENELMAEIRARRLEIRAKKLEQALDGYRKEVFWENRAKQLSAEIQGWQDKVALAEEQTEAWGKRAQELSKELKAAKAQWNDDLGITQKQLGDALNERDKALNERDYNKGEVTKLLKQLSELRSAISVSDMNSRRAMREEKEAKAKLEMVEGQRDHLQKEAERARAAERETCAMIARKAAIEADTAAQSNILMGVVNEIKKRNSE